MSDKPSKFKIGDKVLFTGDYILRDVLHGEVISTSSKTLDGNYPVCVQFNPALIISFTLDGRRNVMDKPTLRKLTKLERALR